MAKILLIPEFSSYGGTFTYFKDVINFYYSLKYEVTVVLKKEQLNQEVIELINKCKYIYFISPEVKKFFKKFKPKFVFTSLFDFFSLLPFYFKIKPDITVVSTGTSGNLLSLIFLPSKFFYVLHTCPIKSKRTFFIRLLLKLNLGKRKKILTVSEFSKKEIIKVWGLLKKEEYINVIYNTSSIKEKSEKIFKNEEIKSIEKIKILTVGHLRWYKNPLLWIEVAKIINNSVSSEKVEFVWAGDGELLKECRNLVKNLDLNNVKFIGFQKEIEDIINSCDIYFQPSIIENFSMCVLDAMRLGKSCVVSEVGGLPEAVKNNETGYVVGMNNKKEMAEKIVLLIKDDNLRLDIGKAGNNRFENYFSYGIWYEKMIKFHENLLKN